MLRQRTIRDRLVAMLAPVVIVAAVASIVLMAGGASAASIGLGVGLATAVAAAWALLVGSTVLRDLDRLAAGASELAGAHAEMVNGQRPDDRLPILEVGPAGDQLTEVAAAVNAVSGSAVESAHTQQESIRKGLATMVINLARRNQSMLDRQVDYLDRLEQSEEDPDRLAELFRVDHLATRMRRNAESLLVLAGADPGKRRGSPVPMSDVLRVAIGEIEKYQQIELGPIADGRLPAGAAVDLAHLTAELMENATQFSPPSTPVDVRTNLDTAAGRYLVTVSDAGMGLGDRLTSANEVLANPPELGLGLGRSLGFIVIGRLALRLGATVRLASNEGGGTVASVHLPLTVFEDMPAPTAQDHIGPLAESLPGPAIASNPLEGGQPAASSTTLEKLLGIAPDPRPAEPQPAPPTPAVPPAPAIPSALAVPEHHDTETDAEAAPAPPMAPLVESIDHRPPDRDEREVTEREVTEREVTEPSTPTPPPASEIPILPALNQPRRASDLADVPPPLAASERAPASPSSASQVDPSAPSAPSSPSVPSSEPPPALRHPAGSAVGGSDPIDWQNTSPFGEEPGSWSPPPEAAPIDFPPPRPDALAEALPSGDAFEQGVASLLTPQAGPPPLPPGPPLTRREKGASNVPIGEGRPVSAPKRTPEEVRAMLSRYRQGLQEGQARAAERPSHDDPNNRRDG